MTKIKICGLKRELDIEYINEFLPEFAGFVFYPKSKRYVDFEKAKSLKSKLDKNIKAVGVFVNEDIEKILFLCKNDIIDIIQLHGNEDEEYIKKLKEKTEKPVIKAVRIDENKKDYSSIFVDTSADYILLDSTAGSGKTFDWEKVSLPKKPFFAAGGINIKNAEKAIKIFTPFALDISSGVETDGVKDREKIKDIINLIRRI